MTEMTFDQAEALGYDGTQRTNNIAPTLEQQIELMSQRIAELQRINEEKVRTIAEKDDRIVSLVNEVERAHASEGIEVQRSADARSEVEAMKRQAVELVEQREHMAREATNLRTEIDRAREVARKEVREGIIQFSDEHDLDREFVNGLLESYLNLDPLPEYVEATVVVEVTARFKAGAGTPGDLSEWFVENNVDFDVTVEPHYNSGLDFEEITHSYVDVRTVETT